MPQFDMSTVVALALAAGVSVSVIGIAMAIAVAKVKMLTKLTLKAMADKATNYVEERESKREQQAIKKLTADISRDTAKAYMVDEVVQAGLDAGMTKEEALADWWERESAASFGSQQKTEWLAFYIHDSQAHGLSYEQAIEWVDEQERRIEKALAYLHAGMSASEAIEAVRNGDLLDVDEDVLSGELVDVYHDRDGAETYEYAGSVEEAIGDIGDVEDDRAQLLARYHDGTLYIPEGFEFDEAAGHLVRTSLERVV